MVSDVGDVTSKTIKSAKKNIYQEKRLSRRPFLAYHFWLLAYYSDRNTGSISELREQSATAISNDTI